MDEKFYKYARNIIGYLSASLPNLYHGNVDDTKILEKWFKKGIPEHFINVIIHEVTQEKGIRTRLSDIDKIVMDRFKTYKEELRKSLRDDFASEAIPERKLEKLYKLLNDILAELEVYDFTALEKLKKLKKENKLSIERQLLEIEGKFYTVLFNYSPFSKECLEQSKKKLEKYKFYWPKRTYLSTLKALIKKCLKEKHGVPEFTVTQIH